MAEVRLTSAKEALRTLTEQAARKVEQTGDALEVYRHRTAFFDTSIDERFTSLPSFSAAADALGALPAMEMHGGSNESRRAALQFVYTFLTGLKEPSFDAKLFEAIREALAQELAETHWTYVGVSNLQNFRSQSDLLELGDGIAIRHRSGEELARLLGWEGPQLAHLYADWEQGAFGSHVLVVEHKVPKTRENLLLVDSTPWGKAQKLLLTLRLLKLGDVRIGRMFLTRPAAFNFGLGGLSSTGFTIFHPGREYSLEPSEVPAIRGLYEMLHQALHLRGRHAERLKLALRSFSSIYDRYLGQPQDRIVDAITAIEALVGTETEVSFQLAFRVAGILAGNDDERVELFERMKNSYDTRSRIVHGDVLRPKDLAILQDDEPLRHVLRRLLVAFLHLSRSRPTALNEGFYKDLNSTLQHTQRRSDLREATGLT